MTIPEPMQLLCSRSLDGDLAPHEQAQLQHALAEDPALRAFLADLQQADRAMRALALRDAMPRRAPRRWPLALAASLILALGLVAVAAWPQPDPPPAPAPAPAMLSFQARSAGVLRLVDGAGLEQSQRDFSGSVALPATVYAPADTHAVLRLAQGTAVLPAGASARLDATDGVPALESLTGDLYLESRTGAVASRVREHAVRVDRGGVTLRRADSAVRAVPSFGSLSVGGLSVAQGQCAVVDGAGLRLDAALKASLDDWAIQGRLDAVEIELRAFFGPERAALVDRHWPAWQRTLRGVMARPADAAALAFTLRFLIRHGWLDEAEESERQLITRFVEIVGEGTTDADVPAPERAKFEKYEARLRENPDAVRLLARIVRAHLERE